MQCLVNSKLPFNMINSITNFLQMGVIVRMPIFEKVGVFCILAGVISTEYACTYCSIAISIFDKFAIYLIFNSFEKVFDFLQIRSTVSSEDCVDRSDTIMLSTRSRLRGMFILR